MNSFIKIKLSEQDKRALETIDRLANEFDALKKANQSLQQQIQSSQLVQGKNQSPQA